MAHQDHSVLPSRAQNRLPQEKPKMVKITVIPPPSSQRAKNRRRNKNRRKKHRKNRKNKNRGTQEPRRPKKVGGGGSGGRGDKNRDLLSLKPFLFRIPRTGFDCRDRAPGYYSDMEADCRVSH